MPCTTLNQSISTNCRFFLKFSYFIALVSSWKEEEGKLNGWRPTAEQVVVSVRAGCTVDSRVWRLTSGTSWVVAVTSPNAHLYPFFNLLFSFMHAWPFCLVPENRRAENHYKKRVNDSLKSYQTNKKQKKWNVHIWQLSNTTRDIFVAHPILPYDNRVRKSID